MGSKGGAYLAEPINGFYEFKSNGALSKDIEKSGGMYRLPESRDDASNLLFLFLVFLY